MGGVAHASQDEARQYFDAGRTASEAGDYATALDAFEKTAAAGLAGPAVQFNIGVAAYRLGRWDRAEAAFLQCARSGQMADLAHYNLGLVALARGELRDANRRFTQVAQETQQPNLRAMAQAQLDRLPAAIEPARNWFAYGAAAFGYDDNVALVANSDVVGVSGNEDAFAELQAAIGAPLSEPWRIDASVFHVDYAEMDAFDQTGLQAGVRYLLTRAKWTYEGGIGFAYTLLDAEEFESSRNVYLRARGALRDDLRAEFRYRFIDNDGLGEFTGLTGQRQELAARLERQATAWRLGYEYRFSDSDYRDPALSVSWHQLGVDAQRDLDDVWSVWLAALARRSSYRDSGDEDRLEFAAELARALGTRWRCLLRYAYATNDSDTPEFNYDRNRISLAIEATW